MDIVRTLGEDFEVTKMRIELNPNKAVELSKALNEIESSEPIIEELKYKLGAHVKHVK